MYLAAMREHPAWPELKALGRCWAGVACAGFFAVFILKAEGPKPLLVVAAAAACYAVHRLRKGLRAFRIKVKQCRR